MSGRLLNLIFAFQSLVLNLQSQKHHWKNWWRKRRRKQKPRSKTNISLNTTASFALPLFNWSWKLIYPPNNVQYRKGFLRKPKIKSCHGQIMPCMRMNGIVWVKVLKSNKEKVCHESMTFRLVSRNDLTKNYHDNMIPWAFNFDVTCIEHNFFGNEN